MDREWFLIKSQSWAYENEYRIFHHLDRCEKVDKNGTVIYFRHLPKTAIKAVYCGANMSVSNLNRIENALKGTSVEKFFCKLSHSHFSLDFVRPPTDAEIGKKHDLSSLRIIEKIKRKEGTIYLFELAKTDLPK